MSFTYGIARYQAVTSRLIEVIHRANQHSGRTSYVDPNQIRDERDPCLCDLRSNVGSVDLKEACPDEAAARGSRPLNRDTCAGIGWNEVVWRAS